MAKILGRMGGVIMIVLGVVGSLFTFGVSLLLTLLGIVLIIYEKAWPFLVLSNVIAVLLCIACYVL